MEFIIILIRNTFHIIILKIFASITISIKKIRKVENLVLEIFFGKIQYTTFLTSRIIQTLTKAIKIHKLDKKSYQNDAEPR